MNRTLGLGALTCFAVSYLMGLGANQRQPKVQPLKTGPIAYYNQNCAHCHGREGSAYGQSFFLRTDLPALKKEIQDMAEGPGQNPIAGKDLEAQVAYHRAMLHRTPFLSWTDANEKNSGMLIGEMTKGATLTAFLGSKSLKPQVIGIKWQLKLPPSADISAIKLIATKDKHQAKLDLAKAAWSEPLILSKE